MAQPPDHVGRFKIIRRLGAGGMGEVYLAQDGELGRYVALKALQPLANSEALQGRLRQEARTVASINHPAVGLIHDLIVEDGQSYLVLEHVEGKSLASVLAEDQLPLETVVQVALDIAEGLAAAHLQGIVHRDLKPENIMITPAGRAKILDFGLATVLSEQEQTSSSGMRAGTLSAMSPEQVEKSSVDHRSDLFSFGTLLYHMVTGSHPFRTGVPVETMQRICHHQPPLSERDRPECSGALPRLIVNLLRKDPNRRPTTGQVVNELQGIRKWLDSQGGEAEEKSSRSRLLVRVAVGVTFIVITTFVSWRLLHRVPPEPLSVAVLRVAHEGPEAPPEIVLSAIRLAAVNTLAGLEGIHVINTGEIDAISGGREAVARGTAADEILTMVVSYSDLTSRVEVSRVDGTTGHMRWSDQVEIPNDDLLLVSETISAHLTKAYHPRDRRPGVTEVTATPEDYTEFLTTREKVLNPTAETSWPTVLNELEEVRRGSPRLLNAYVLEASVARYLYEVTRDEEYLSHARGVVAAAIRFAPDDYRTHFAAAEVAVATEPYEVATEVIARLERLEPTNPAVIRQKARLAEIHGKTAEAAELLRRVVSRQPSWRNLLALAKIERLLGEVSGARQHLSEALERSPGNITLMGERANLELMIGDASEAERLLLDVAARSPQVLCLTRLGTAQVLRGRLPEALKNYQHALSLGSQSPPTTFNLADCYNLLGNHLEAKHWYEETLSALHDDLSVKGRELKAKSFAQLGELDRAEEIISRALEADPDSPETNYSAAVVFAVAGKREMAQAHADTALQAGLSPAWFNYPWFEGIRR